MTIFAFACSINLLKELREEDVSQQRKKKCGPECPGDDTCEDNTVCMCGAYMDGHDAMWSGHTPVSVHVYYCEQVEATPRAGT